MKHLPFFLISMMLLCTFGCSTGKADATNETEIEDSLINNVNSESLEFWTADTIIKINPRLVRLMDTLYQYTRNELHQNDVSNNRKWMQEYRNQLCNYYRETRQSDNISDFAMADSIISEANNLWSHDNDESTLGMNISNDAELARLIFQHFNEYEKLNSICKSEEQREILLKEFTDWLRLESLFCKIFANCVNLHYWGGTMSGPVGTSGTLDICKVHIDLYKKEYLIISNSGNEWEDNGTFLLPTKSLLISCCQQALEEYYCPEVADSIRYNEIYKETKTLFNELPKQIDAWCRARQAWEDEMSSDWLRPEYARHTSEVLIKLAHIISSVQ